MNFLVTGGCGFIGRNLIARLTSAHDHRVRVVDNFSVGRPDDLMSILAQSGSRSSRRTLPTASWRARRRLVST